jgi:glyoxylase-like metal-dependent hydrolase (beta-lactamase superfamily II)
VRHIVMTHLDFDHAGGLADFPGAQVHVTRMEARAARTRLGWRARLRWRPAQFPARFVEHEVAGEDFHGRPSLAGLPAGLRFLPLPGHSPGHAGVLIEAEDGYVLHAGDAIFDMRELAAPGMAQPMALAYEAAMQVDAAQRRASADAVRDLARRASAELTVLCTHDPRLPPAERLILDPALND